MANWLLPWRWRDLLQRSTSCPYLTGTHHRCPVTVHTCPACLGSSADSGLAHVGSGVCAMARQMYGHLAATMQDPCQKIGLTVNYTPGCCKPAADAAP